MEAQRLGLVAHAGDLNPVAVIINKAWIEPVVEGKNYRFETRVGEPVEKKRIGEGTRLGRGGDFRCILSDSPIMRSHIRAEGVAGRMGSRLMAIVAKGDHGLIFLSPTEAHEEIARQQILAIAQGGNCLNSQDGFHRRLTVCRGLPTFSHHVN